MVALFIISTFLCFILVDYVLHHRKQQNIKSPALISEKFLIPRGYFFSPNHLWVHLLPSGNAQIGIDDFLQKIVGTIEHIHLVPNNSFVRKGEPLLIVSQGEKTLTLASPLTGKIQAHNSQVTDTKYSFASDPYFSGWVLEIIPERIGEEIKSLSLAEQVEQWLKNEISRFRDFIASQQTQLAYAHNGMTMFDGGIPMNGALAQGNEKTWLEFEQQFLTIETNNEASQ